MSTITFEKALEKLSAVVSQLENGNLPLEKSLKLYEEGVSLSAYCEQELNRAALRIRELHPADQKEEEENHDQ
ncbi:MAG: exodeoxyribonuclease VII small subunit [Candidatus Merdivicinus sp.]|jgi:exodeoxyribonuclease VII small subunit